MTTYTPAQVSAQCKLIADRMMMGDESAHDDFWALYDELEQQEDWPPNEYPAPDIPTADSAPDQGGCAGHDRQGDRCPH